MKNAVKIRKAPAPVKFETALGWLRRGLAVRRREWHTGAYIFKAGGDVFVKLPNIVNRAPQTWVPYPQDVLASDWEKKRVPA